MVPLILAYWLTQPVPSYGAADNGPAFPSPHTDSILRCERPKESPFKRLAMPYSHSQRLSEMTEERSTPLSCTVYKCIIAHAILPVKPFFTFLHRKFWIWPDHSHHNPASAAMTASSSLAVRNCKTRNACLSRGNSPTGSILSEPEKPIAFRARNTSVHSMPP